MKELVDVRGDGNCFYRAVYGYILHNKNINIGITAFLNLFECREAIQQNISKIDKHFADDDVRKRLYNQGQEDSWDACIRDYLSKYILAKKTGIVKQFYDSLMALDMPTYKMVIQSYTDWFKTYFGEEKPEDLDTFALVFAGNIKKTGTEACQLDIDIFKHILRFYGYNLRIDHISNASEAVITDSLAMLPETPEPNTIYLIHLPGHYNFVLFKEDVIYVGGSRNSNKYGKVMINNKLYKKHYDAKKKKYYVKKTKKMVYI